MILNLMICVSVHHKVRSCLHQMGLTCQHIITAADPEQVNTLYGDGRIEAEYVKPLHVSIEERVAAVMHAE